MKTLKRYAIEFLRNDGKPYARRYFHWNTFNSKAEAKMRGRPFDSRKRIVTLEEKR